MYKIEYVRFMLMFRLIFIIFFFLKTFWKRLCFWSVSTGRFCNIIFFCSFWETVWDVSCMHYSIFFQVNKEYVYLRYRSGCNCKRNYLILTKWRWPLLKRLSLKYTSLPSYFRVVPVHIFYTFVHGEDQPQTNNDLYNEQTTINEGNPEKVCPGPFSNSPFRCYRLTQTCLN